MFSGAGRQAKRPRRKIDHQIFSPYASMTCHAGSPTPCPPTPDNVDDTERPGGSAESTLAKQRLIRHIKQLPFNGRRTSRCEDWTEDQLRFYAEFSDCMERERSVETMEESVEETIRESQEPTFISEPQQTLNTIQPTKSIGWQPPRVQKIELAATRPPFTLLHTEEPKFKPSPWAAMGYGLYNGISLPQRAVERGSAFANRAPRSGHVRVIPSGRVQIQGARQADAVANSKRSRPRSEEPAAVSAATRQPSRLERKRPILAVPPRNIDPPSFTARTAQAELLLPTNFPTLPLHRPSRRRASAPPMSPARTSSIFNRVRFVEAILESCREQTNRGAALENIGTSDLRETISAIAENPFDADIPRSFAYFPARCSSTVVSPAEDSAGLNSPPFWWNRQCFMHAMPNGEREHDKHIRVRAQWTISVLDSDPQFLNLRNMDLDDVLEVEWIKLNEAHEQGQIKSKLGRRMYKWFRDEQWWRQRDEEDNEGWRRPERRPRARNRGNQNRSVGLDTNEPRGISADSTRRRRADRSTTRTTNSSTRGTTSSSTRATSQSTTSEVYPNGLADANGQTAGERSATFVEDIFQPQGIMMSGAIPPGGTIATHMPWELLGPTGLDGTVLLPVVVDSNEEILSSSSLDL